MRRLVLWLALAVPALAESRVLTLERVLESVQKHYPPLIAALREKEIAQGELLVAEGRFDLTARARLDSDEFGFYQNRRWDAGVEQPLAFGGMSLTGGWRLGDGSFAPYDGKLQTRSGGEWRGGLRMPLLRDREIDSRRAELQKARIGTRLADLSVEQQRLIILQTATRRYWDWVAAGQRYAVVKMVLDIAVARENQLKDAVALGQLPPVEVADNARAIAQRRSQLVEADRFVQQAAFDLSLFFRGDNGEATVPTMEQLPPAFPQMRALEQAQVMADLEAALNRRPDLLRVREQRDQTQVDARLARNQASPNIDLVFGFTQEAGEGPVRRGPGELKGGIVFELPFQRRNAKGRELAARARIEQFNQRERFTRDQIGTEVQDAASAVRAAFERAKVISEEVQLTRQMEDAERTRYELGDSTLFVLNLRELQTVEALIREVNANADYHRAIAVYELATAEPLLRFAVP